ncbi:hypothetical protein NKH53_18450 [Mesorhizobium australicum]|uniref:ComEC/Rec2 family competence protein n=1 Tax=Mesorhizobium australicum TaxID=536018 RepID=UPI00333995A2
MGYEIDFLPVGDSNGDAICIRYGSPATGYTIHVVDGGYTDTGDTIVGHINQYFGNPNFIDHVVLSHADNDHVAGLITVLEHFDVGHLWMNRPWLYAAEILDSFHGNYTVAGLQEAIMDAYPLLVDLEQIAFDKGTQVHEAFAFAQIGQFTVLAPSRERYLQLIPEFNRTPASYAKPIKGWAGRIVEAVKALVHYFETWGEEQLEENPPACTAANESSLVQLGRIDGKAMLLTADVGPEGLNEAADNTELLGVPEPLVFVQVPHHGSRRNVTPSVLNRWLGGPVPEGVIHGTAFCSVGSNKPEYPRRRVQNAFLRRGYGVISNRKGWISHFFQMPARAGAVGIDPEPFVTVYEE